MLDALAEAGIEWGGDDEDDSLGPAPSWVGQLADAFGWSTTFTAPLDRKEHINPKELRAKRMLFRKLAAREEEGALRVLGLQDSKVALGCEAKGRSPSGQLNGILRNELCDTLFGGLYWGGIHCPTKQNPADDPSRNRPPRPQPAAPPPSGWSSS